MKRRTSFYLPKDTAKHLHVSSQTRVQEVIEALLNKFTVVDNPAKFALFERTERQSQGNVHNSCWKKQKSFVLNVDFYSPQCPCVSCLMMNVHSTYACVLVPVKRFWVWFWKKMRRGISMYVSRSYSDECINIFLTSQYTICARVILTLLIALLHSGMHLAFLSCAISCESCSVRRKSMSGRLWSAMRLLKKRWSRLWQGLLPLVDFEWCGWWGICNI